ncbi:MAG: DUF2934 domain-containing protein [Dehalococcoidales bacterium]|nr:DUF2934 domain-containing protein [Dehalococcoidales bacterium]
MGREDEIRTIAYRIWEEEGCGNGRDCEHWLMAETIWEDKKKSEASLKDSEAEFGQTEPRGIHHSLLLKMLGR